MSKGILYLIPTTLGSEEPLSVVPGTLKSVVDQIDYYIVENEKHARRYLRALDIDKQIRELTLFPLNKHTPPEDLPSYIRPALEGHNIGVISEAGCPGVADPGSEMVSLAHSKGIQVAPLVGPSSILLALMASGFNGQQFTFHGYLPKDRKERSKHLKHMETQVRQTGGSQIFMDTPFRNDHVMQDHIQELSPDTKICVAADITLENEFIKTQSMVKWKKSIPSLNKRPVMFVMGE